jgi:hypothetical protein
MTSNQIKRLNEIISDKTRPVGERLKELFRRDGLTIGAVITAIGMVIIIITNFISYCRPLGPRTLLCPGQDPGLDKQLQINNINIKQCKYKQLVVTRILIRLKKKDAQTYCIRTSIQRQ